MRRTAIKIGITATNRKELNISVRSCIHAFDTQDIILFCEPETKINTTIIKFLNKEKLGCWNNWYNALYTLHNIFPKSDYYGIFQDDVRYAKNVREYLMNIDLPPIFSIFKPQHYLLNNGRWASVSSVGELWMAQTLFFNNEIVKRILANQTIWKVRSDKQIDNRVGIFAKIIGADVSYHVPSLCQHIGHESTIWKNNVKAVENRAANDFVGEDFDCLKLLSVSSI